MNENIIEKLSIKNGMQVDLDEGWHKVISRQFGGNPGRGFAELIQNLIDSYSPTIPMEERKGEIHTGPLWISITDYGSGLNREKLKLLTTLGGTDKAGDNSKIGAFGIGFFSIFNPRLFTQKVEVITRCEGQTVNLIFTVKAPKTPPNIDYKLIKEKFPFSTQIKVNFTQQEAVSNCLGAMNQALKFYPCQINVNGVPFQSIWQNARENDNYLFNHDGIKGFIQRGIYDYRVSLMCKYENLGNMSMNAFLTGGHGTKYTLEDLAKDNIPYLPNRYLYVNDNRLNVTISRDSFYLDHNWRHLKSNLSKILLDYMATTIPDLDEENLIANIYIFRHDIKAFLQKKPSTKAVIVKLAEAKLFRINEKAKRFSLRDIYKRHDHNLPLFFSPDRKNRRWLGGDFKHDFIVLPPQTLAGQEVPCFWKSIFSTIFTNAVDLDHIMQDQQKLQELVEQEIISKDALATESKVVGSQSLSQKQSRFLNEIQNLLCLDPVKNTIEDTLKFRIRSILPVFIKFENNNTYISSGLLDQNGMPIDDQFISNLQSEKQGDHFKAANLLLGLSQDHPFIQKLVQSTDPHRAYYSLTYVAHELALTQKLLVPYSSFFYLVKNRLANSVRRALIDHIIAKKV